MSQATPYEQLIAAKLEQLPSLPGMADEIWLRIERELDAGTPPDDDGSGGEPTPGIGPTPGNGPAPRSGPDAPASAPDLTWKGWSFLLVAGALIVVFMNRNQLLRPASVPAEEPAPNYRVLPPANIPGANPSPPVGTGRPGNAGSNTGSGEENRSSSPPVLGDSAGLLLPPGIPGADSAVIANTDSNAFPPPVVRTDSLRSPRVLPADSGAAQPPAAPPGEVDSRGRKKPAAVKLDSAGYKIVPKKDSSR